MKFIVFLLVTIAVSSADQELLLEQMVSQEGGQLFNLYQDNNVNGALVSHMVNKRNLNSWRPRYLEYFVNQTVSFVEVLRDDSCEEDSDNLRVWDLLPISYKRYFLMLVNVTSRHMEDFKWDNLDNGLQDNLLSIKDFISNKKSFWMKKTNIFMGIVLNHVNFDVCLDENELKQMVLNFVDSEFDNQLKLLVDLETKPSPILGFDLINILLGFILNHK